MFKNMIAAIPADMQDVWYLYDLMLLAAIVILAFILVLLKKKSGTQEGEKNTKSAINMLKKAVVTAESAKLRFRLYSAKNLLRSAVFSYKQILQNDDMLDLTAKIDKLQKNIDAIEELSKETNAENIKDEILKIISDLS